jgi:serine beta-lactamase-like protein LACTB
MLLALSLAVVSSSVLAAEPVNLDAAKQDFGEHAQAELARGIVPGFSVAWVVDGRTVHVAGYGLADKDHAKPTTPETIYRAGSISKLFNAVAAMQLVEQGKLDLDAPIEQALPEFSISVPFADAGPITARQLLCHRSGMIRETPVGGYLDPRQPTVKATVASVAGCALVNRPNTKTRYSNVGPTIVGRAVEVQTGIEYAEYQRQKVLEPLGMTGSAWRMNDALRPHLAVGQMRVARGDGTYGFEPAPEFELGTLPAGNLYTSAVDLARFAAYLMGGSSDAPAPEILKRENLEKMFEVQLTKESAGFGLGFYRGDYRGHKTVQHSGAVYGFSTSMIVLPKEKIAAIVLANADIAAAPVRRLSERSLNLLLEAILSEKPPTGTAPVELSSEALAEFLGEYESQSFWAKMELDGARLRATLSGQPLELTPLGPLEFMADGRIMNQAPVKFERDKDGKISSFTAAGQTFHRVATPAGAHAPWQNLVGTYGPRFIPLVVSTRNGHLYATVENEYDYRLTPLNTVTFNNPPGMYSDEQTVFQTDKSGKAIGAVFANQYLERHAD